MPNVEYELELTTQFDNWTPGGTYLGWVKENDLRLRNYYGIDINNIYDPDQVDLVSPRGVSLFKYV